MSNLDVRHYLTIYTLRKQMHDEGLTNPSEPIRQFTIDLIEKLKTYPLDEIIITEKGSFFDSKGNFIMSIPQ